MTKEIVSVAQPLGISVHDHIIVGKDGHARFKGLRLICRRYAGTIRWGLDQM
jgi:DNA repair protein RadC